MNTQLEPRAVFAMKPLDVVGASNQTRFEYAVDNLEKQICHYINTQAQNCEPLQMKFIKDLFFQAKSMVRR